MSRKAKPLTPREEIDQAYADLDKVLSPLVRGDGDSDPVREARLAVQGLQLMRQWARLGATVDAAGLFRDRVKLQAAELVAAGKLTAEVAEAFVVALAGKGGGKKSKRKAKP